jgi:hypothetical protein
MQMKNLRPAILALLFSALAAGFALCMNVVHYRTWSLVPPDAFARFQDSSAIHTVPAAVVLGLPSLFFALIVARRGLPGVSSAWFRMAVGLAALPWVATPLWFVGLQGRLSAAGPTQELVAKLVWGDLLLRAAPPLIQALIQWRALQRSLGGDGVTRGGAA